jgi:hypothetical protein
MSKWTRKSRTVDHAAERSSGKFRFASPVRGLFVAPLAEFFLCGLQQCEKLQEQGLIRLVSELGVALG